MRNVTDHFWVKDGSLLIILGAWYIKFLRALAQLEEVSGTQLFKVILPLGVGSLRILWASLLDYFDAELVGKAETSILAPEKNGFVQVVDDDTETEFGELELVYH